MAGADQGGRGAWRKEATKNRGQEEKPIMPDGEKERVLPAQPHNIAAIVQFETQCAHPELD